MVSGREQQGKSITPLSKGRKLVRLWTGLGKKAIVEMDPVVVK